ncbi:MAG: sensor histidine kinase [Bacteroidales bacterium]|nr:MAG: sensor histidine kinase [Bacteroidales bacterium]
MGKHLSDEELLAELKKRFEGNKKALRELKNLNDELILVNKKLEESEALKSHFVSNITNEIINPFTSILGLSKAILSVEKENWKRVFSMIALIHSEAFSLDFQFRNIFVAAKIEAGDIYPEIFTVDIKNLIDSVIESFKYESKKKHLTVNVIHCESLDGDKPFVFKTDPEKLKLIFSNLIRNAITFSYENGQVDVKLCNKDNNLILQVKDHGIGISKENHTIIFDRFNRLDSGINSVNRGHGLGLSVSKAIIDLLKGRIEIESELGKGASFTLYIPESNEASEGFASDANEAFFNDFDKF